MKNKKTKMTLSKLQKYFKSGIQNVNEDFANIVANDLADKFWTAFSGGKI